MSYHEIIETPNGLELHVEGAQVATIRQRGGALDLVWQVRGPQDLEQARRSIVGLIDLLVHYDSMSHPAIDWRRAKKK